MRNTEELSQKVNTIEKNLKELQEQQKKLCDEVRFRDDIPFLLKFKVWAVYTRSKMQLCQPYLSRFPNVKKLLNSEGYKFQVNCTSSSFDCSNQINVFERWGDKFEKIINGTIENEEEKTLIENVMKELFENNVRFLSCKNE